MQDNDIMYFVIIANRNDKKKYIELLKKYKVFGITSLYANGSYKASYVSKAFGLNVERKKILLACLAYRKACQELIDVLNKEYSFDKHNTGIAYCISLEQIGY